MRLIGCALLSFCIFTAKAQDKFTALDQWLKNNSANLGGRAVLLIYKEGKIVYSKAHNDLSWRQRTAGRIIARRQGKNPEELLKNFDEHTQQPIASCSKWLSAALVMTFVDEGKLRLQDSIGMYLPVMTANGKGQITISHCLSHLTGIKQVGLGEGDEDNSNEARGRPGWAKNRGGGLLNKWPSMDAAIDSIVQMPMEGEPGKTFHYGNAGLQIAAAIIEKISGKNFETVFQERIARPCGMTNTTFGSGAVPLAAGGAKGTAMDYLHFLQMVLTKGVYNGKRVLSEKSVAAMQVNYAKDARVVYTPAAGAGWGYGYGEWVMRESDAGGAVSSPGLFGSFPWVDYEKGYCAMLFTVNLKNRQRAELYKGLLEVVGKSL
jgi:CubicO group peptidase (beta-lactamase class C family)